MQATGQHVPVIIIGAGPAGLTLGAQLKKRGVEFLLLDKGRAGDSWERMPPHLKLVSPWKCNWLLRGDEGWFSANAELTRAEFLNYLRRCAAENDLPIQAQCEVFSVERTADGFRVTTSREELVSRLVVNATGYFSHPVRPRLEGADATDIPQLHYADHQSAERVRAIAGANPLVLLVGKRLSAGQTLLELVDAGLRVALSHRSPIQFGVDDWLWPFVYRHFVHAEKLKLMLSGGRAPRLDVRMPGGRARKLLQSGAVATFPAVARFEKNSVTFADGRQLAPGVVLYATGFAPTLNHLQKLNLTLCADTGMPLTRDMESASVPDLFFLGFDMLRNFQSRFLRGIRNDAVVLADIIAARVQNASRIKTTERCVA